MAETNKQKVVIVGAGPVGSLAALYAAARGDDVEVYELRGGISSIERALMSFFARIDMLIYSRSPQSGHCALEFHQVH